ncbi:hypothetical protein H6F77_16110 [Microcoleus sp. FACHB-831]|uniref:hypothetical protein n=1 Tax=Microcoleus sp. FACHB-831 TaxID=2692827 RepID=UPI001687273C|nr:hypothetical protein [Microcoleus sp. FACHB-831]MBD1922594.1 hypothetical protein [Microcoleus sp. FACHB-831]
MQELNEKASSASEKRLRFLERQQTRFSKNDAMGLFALGTLGLHLLTFFVLILLYGAYSSLSKKSPPTLVQLDTGEAITVAPLGNKERTPQVVKKFTIDTMTLMLNWSGTKPPSTVEEATKPVLDPGVDVGSAVPGRAKVTTAAWQAGFALSEDFRKEFLAKLAEITPSGVFKSATQVALVPLEIQEPQKIAEGKWKIKIVANLIVLDKGNNLGQVIPFNKEIFIQAVESPVFPGDKGGVAAIIYQVRTSGLEIYAIRDLQQENL